VDGILPGRIPDEYDGGKKTQKKSVKPHGQKSVARPELKGLAILATPPIECPCGVAGNMIS
jgi:hypothetical protein